MRSCVVIPTYNEFDNIDDVISRVLEHDDIDVLVVDDSSPDRTGDKVEIWAEKTNGRVSLVTRAKKDGLGSAYLFGFAHCIKNGYDVICEMDADLSHDPAALPGLVEPVLNSDADLVLGSRYVEGGSIPNWSMHRKLLSLWGNRYARFMLGLSVSDATGGFRAYRSELLETIMKQTIRGRGYGFQIEMVYVATQENATIIEVPIAFSDRIRGTSKMSSSIVAEALGLVTWWTIRDRLFRRRNSSSRQQVNTPADTTSIASKK